MDPDIQMYYNLNDARQTECRECTDLPVDAKRLRVHDDFKSESLRLRVKHHPASLL